MNQYHHLVGAEEVNRAGHSMQSAAESFRQSVGFLLDGLHQHQRFMDEWLQRFEEVLKSQPAETTEAET